jgi:hypothetical protein
LVISQAFRHGCTVPNSIGWIAFPSRRSMDLKANFRD